ncbi:alpha/beta fold hydrolase [Phenylobacterium montanum]|uniref:Alpha/beta hydrolase n=1 Tax=Phenylobacterium montanum TaxID=2823693 RepID=A0A975FZB7_9CAUL|nr:alpha/beta hydrolase [Caulobacter sp. S6]QUD87638.1 alpha/beta hydrolase [Caulobacter sp. S6]
MDTRSGPGPSALPVRRRFDLPALGPDARLAAVEFGDPARPFDLIFLHANGFNAMTYRDVLAPLAGRLHVLAVDQQGHGGSPQRTAIEGRTSWSDLSLDLIALLDLLDGPPVVLAGHSLGGAVSLFAAAQRPDRVRALALFDPVIPSKAMVAQLLAAEGQWTRGNPLAEGALRRRAVFPSRQAVIDSYRGRGPFKTWPDAALEGYVEDGFAERDDGQVELTCAPAWESSNFRSHGHDPWSYIARLTVPVTVLRASNGSTCNLVSEDELPDTVPRKHVETIADSTHFLPIERPDLTRATLLAACLHS